jgi:hypothetical protein
MNNIIQNAKENPVIKSLVSLWNNLKEYNYWPRFQRKESFNHNEGRYDAEVNPFKNKKPFLQKDIKTDSLDENKYTKPFTYNNQILQFNGAFMVPIEHGKILKKCPNSTISAILNIYVFVFDILTHSDTETPENRPFKTGDIVFICDLNVKDVMTLPSNNLKHVYEESPEKFKHVRCKIVGITEWNQRDEKSGTSKTIQKYNLKTIDSKANDKNPIKQTLKDVREEWIVRSVPKLIVRLYYSDKDYTADSTSSQRFIPSFFKKQPSTENPPSTEVLFYDYCELHDNRFNNYDEKYDMIPKDVYPKYDPYYPLGGGRTKIYSNDLSERIEESLGLPLPSYKQHSFCVELSDAQRYNIYFRGKKYYSPSGKIRDKDGNFIGPDRDFETLKIV